MGMFNDIIRSIVDSLKEDHLLSDIEFSLAYKPKLKSNPINKVYAVLGFSGIDIGNMAFSDFSGTSEYGELSIKQSEFLVNLRIYSPRKLGGENLTVSFDKICESLLFGNFKKRIASIKSGDIKFDSMSLSYIMDVTLKLKIYLGNEENFDAISDVVVKGVY